MIIENIKSTIKVNDAKFNNGIYPFYTSGQSILTIKNYLVDGHNIFLNTGGAADVKYYIGKASYSTDTWCIKGINKLTDYLFLYLFSIIKEINDSYFEGSALKHLQKQNLKCKKIYIPSKNEAEVLYNVFHPIFIKISKNIDENRKLTNIRDLLLPKLMSGEIDVSKIKL